MLPELIGVTGFVFAFILLWLVLRGFGKVRPRTLIRDHAFQSVALKFFVHKFTIALSIVYFLHSLNLNFHVNHLTVLMILALLGMLWI